MSDVPIINDHTLLDQAIRKAEESERPFYECMKLLKQASSDLKPLLINRDKYFNAMRAIKKIAKVECESADVQPIYPDCETAIVSGSMETVVRCWPCYARHVIKGGAP